MSNSGNLVEERGSQALSIIEVIEFCLGLPNAYDEYSFSRKWTVVRHKVSS